MRHDFNFLSFCRSKSLRLIPAALMLTTSGAVAQPSGNVGGYAVNWSAEAIGSAGNGDFAPYYIASNNHGIITQSNNALLRLCVWRPHEEGKRFSYSFGVDLITGWSSSTDYLRFRELTPGSATAPGAIDVVNGALWPHSEHPSRLWIQQLYGEMRYRGVFLTAGMKQHSSALLSHTLSSGDLVESGNARPIPEVRVGFNDFQDIPFTNSWLQIQGEISYGKMTDNKWLRNHYNYYDSHLNQGALYSYKRCYFRTNPSKPFSGTVGMQVGAFFGGKTSWYSHGKLERSASYSSGIKEFFKIFIPSDGGSHDYYSGSSLGSWDLMLRYRFNNGASVKAYMQKPWEDGSGIGCLNGFDGLWGLQFTAARRGLVTGAVIEYLDFTNQGGPMHWDPDDHPGTDITNRAEGCDNYYYNHEFNAYANYGMAIGTPFMVSPVYNTDGYLQFAYNRIRGFHIGVEGDILPTLSYRVLGGYRRSWGSGSIPLFKPLSDTSVMAEASYAPSSLKNISFKAQIALDHGELLGNHFGALVTVKITDVLHLGK